MVAFSTDICYVVNRIGSYPVTRLLSHIIKLVINNIEISVNTTIIM